MNIEEINNKTVAQMVTDQISSAHIFKTYGIDFCCGGGISIEKACEKKGVSTEVLIGELLENVQVNSPRNNYDSWSLPHLIDHIIEVHHKYVLDTLPILKSYAEKAARAHGVNYPQLLKINKLVQLVNVELKSHLRKEEQILFPYVKQLLSVKKGDDQGNSLEFGNIQNPIEVLTIEHESAGDAFKLLALLTDNYSPPPKACNTFKALYHLLEEFEKDLHLHVHLENNILFPKALQLSQEEVNQ